MANLKRSSERLERKHLIVSFEMILDARVQGNEPVEGLAGCSQLADTT
jgi:hypothetical protein